MYRQHVRHRLLETDQLVQAFVDGDVAALDELVRRYRHVPVSAARRHLHASAEVDDVAQETWFRFTLHAAGIREPARLPSWLWVTAANEARRRRQRASRQQLVDGFDDHPAESAEDETITTPERRAAVSTAAAARLNHRERQLLALLMDARGLDYREISGWMYRPVGAIGPTRARIIRKLRSHPDVARLRAAVA